MKSTIELNELLVEASQVIEELLALSEDLLGAYGYGISNTTHDKAMVVLGSIDSYRHSNGITYSGFPEASSH